MIDTMHILQTLGRCGYIHGRLSREIKERIDAEDIDAPGYRDSDKKASMVVAYCVAAGKRWPEYESMIAVSGSSVHETYALKVLKLSHGLARYWGYYMDWVEDGRPGISFHLSRATQERYEEIDEHLNRL